MRRSFATACAVLALAAHAHADAQHVARVDAAVKKAALFLVSKQDEDGAWRSGVHGSFKDGPSLTPLVLVSLRDLRDVDPAIAKAYERGEKYLLLNSPGSADSLRMPYNFPLYTNAMGAVLFAGGTEGDRKLARDGFVESLKDLQLNKRNGWEPGDILFGGWGYHPRPRKPTGDQTGPPMGPPKANLSATVFALTGLAACKVPTDDPAWRDVQAFLRNCQNFSADEAKGDHKFDDGGFTFSPDDVATNKPGPAGKDRFGRERLRSYGSATADGVRCLLLAGTKPDDKRVAAARWWLISHFDATKNPGTFNEDRKSLAIATKYYWLWTAAHAFKALGLKTLETPEAHPDVDWRAAITDELLKLQRDDGSWKNDLSDNREDDPIVATSFALQTLRICGAK